jgi:hypothetical protein
MISRLSGLVSCSVIEDVVCVGRRAGGQRRRSLACGHWVGSRVRRRAVTEGTGWAWGESTTSLKWKVLFNWFCSMTLLVTSHDESPGVGSRPRGRRIPEGNPLRSRRWHACGIGETR